MKHNLLSDNHHITLDPPVYCKASPVCSLSNQFWKKRKEMKIPTSCGCQFWKKKRKEIKIPTSCGCQFWKRKRKEIKIPTSCDCQSSQALTRCSAQASVEWSLSPRYLCAPQHNDMAKFRFPHNFYLSSTTPTFFDFLHAHQCLWTIKHPLSLEKACLPNLQLSWSWWHLANCLFAFWPPHIWDVLQGNSFFNWSFLSLNFSDEFLDEFQLMK